ncbi:MAG: response regulator [Proteobacteria bacterium]|nr:response regulator [Pseudomonadota bacterium]
MSQANKWRVLIVDDEEGIRENLAEVFGGAGFEVTTAGDGFEATKIIEAQAFDAVITDVNMPRMNGMQLAENIRSSGLNSKAQIFILSAFAGDDVLKKSISLGSVNVLPKPFDVTAAVRLVKEKLKDGSTRTNLDPIIADCFSSAAAELTSYYLQKTPVVGKVTAWQQPMPSSYATGLISLSGPGVDGFLTLSLSRKLLKAFSDALFGDSEMSISESMMADIVGELINQTAGRTQMNLAKQNITITIGLPQVVLGPGHKIFQKGGGSASRIDFTVNDDAYSLDFNLRYHS